MFNYKFKLFSISLIAVWLVLFIKNVDVPFYFGTDSQFVGWKRLLTFGNVIAVMSLVMTIVAIVSFIQLRHRLQGSPDGLTTTITEVHDKSYEYINTLVSIVTLFSVILVPVVSTRDFIVFIIMMLVISICFLKTNLYYSNPIFAALGYRLYTVKSNSPKLPENSVVIYHGVLSNGVPVNSYHVSDDVYFLK